MSSGRSSWWRRLMHKLLPFLFKRCPEYNYHWRWDRLCYCRVNEHGGVPNWHGGIYDFKTGFELHEHCDDDHYVKLCNFADSVATSTWGGTEMLTERHGLKMLAETIKRRVGQGETKKQRANRTRKKKRKSRSRP